MTREEAKEWLPIIQAWAEDKSIQCQANSGSWSNITKDLYTGNSPSKYRIKPEPKYRPFNSQEECWNEMLKHQPFGWVRSTMSDNLYLIESISDEINCNRAVTSYNVAFEWFKFADGTPFGIKEDI